MKIFNKKRVAILLQAVTLTGILVAFASGICLLWEMLDLYMLDSILYSMQPDEQLLALHEEVDDMLEDGIACGVVAGVAMVVSFISGLVATVLTGLIKTALIHKANNAQHIS